MANEGAVVSTVKVAISGTLEFHDKDGNVMGTTDLTATLPVTQPDAVEAGEANGLDDD